MGSKQPIREEARGCWWVKNFNIISGGIGNDANKRIFLEKQVARDSSSKRTHKLDVAWRGEPRADSLFKRSCISTGMEPPPPPPLLFLSEGESKLRVSSWVFEYYQICSRILGEFYNVSSFFFSRPLTDLQDPFSISFFFLNY